jgi:hypothetical protein
VHIKFKQFTKSGPLILEEGQHISSFWKIEQHTTMTFSISAAFQTRRGSIFQNINKQNMKIWSAESPHEFVETPLHP